MKHIYLILLFFTLLTTTKAQFKIDAEYRPRFEFRDGYGTLKTAESDPAYFTTQRTRLNLNHTHNNLTSRLSFQDYRVWGEAKIKADVPSVSIYEAWFKLQLNDYWSLTAGRQSFTIDNKRLFTKSNWNQVSLSHDGITIDYLERTFSLKIVTAFNQSSVSNFGTDYSAQFGNYKFLNVIWLEKKIGNLSLANLTLTDAYQKEGTTNTDYYRFTTGAVIKYKKAAEDIQIRGFYQTGKNKTGQDVSAYFANAIWGHKFGSILRLTGGFEYMSGNDLTDKTNKKDNAFDILYGTRHAFNGIMDYFSIPKTTKSAGLLDAYLKIDITKIRNWKLSTQYHYFALTNKYEFENVEQDNFLAHEIDFIGDLKVNDIVNLQIGYGMLFASKTLEYVKGVEAQGLQHYFYTMITVKPTFLRIND